MFTDINAYNVGLSITDKALKALVFNQVVTEARIGKMPVVRLVVVA